MTLPNMILKKEEQVIFRLRALFEQFGYHKFKMSKFESYDFYAENRNFLNCESILTFSGLDGKLMALKPDVTLSIVKNTKGSYESPARVYYNENVYRARKGAGEYKEIMQVGLEYIGEVDRYATIEVIRLAIKSLRLISENYIMDLSHMGFLSGLMESCALPLRVQEKMLEHMSEKNLHGIVGLAEENQVAPEDLARLLGVTSLYGKMSETLPKARAFCANEKMTQALDELVGISATLIDLGEDEINLDFSIVNGMDYYNGIIFQGFIDGVPTGILSGGRYDHLVHKLGKQGDAIGFAVYLDLLERFEQVEKPYDVDILLLYGEETAEGALVKAVEMLTGNGQSVAVQKKNTGNLRYKQLWCMKERGLELLGEND